MTWEDWLYKSLVVLLNAAMYVPLALGIGTAFRVARFPDLTAEGSFTIGAAASFLLLEAGLPLPLVLAGSLLPGAMAGLLTGAAHFWARVPAILSGILTWMASYSIGLRLLGRPNVRLDPSGLIVPLGGRADLIGRTLLGLAIVTAVIALAAGTVWVFLESRAGLRLRCAGGNAAMARSLGIRPTWYVLGGLMAANALAALSGALFAGVNGYVDINMGAGMLIGGVASLFLGAVLLPGSGTLQLIGACMVGSLILRGVVAVSLELGLEPGDLRLLMALLLLVSIWLSGWRRSRSFPRAEEPFVLS